MDRLVQFVCKKIKRTNISKLSFDNIIFSNGIDESTIMNIKVIENNINKIPDVKSFLNITLLFVFNPTKNHQIKNSSFIT